MGAYALFTDVQNAYEATIPDDQQDWINNLIDRAERLLKARVPGFPARVDDGSLDSAAVVDAVVAAVLRVVRNPEGMQSETEGNYLYSAQRDVAGGKLFYTGDDLALVRALSQVGARLLRSPVTR